jgi:outer membrane lipoprotein-sorting protein
VRTRALLLAPLALLFLSGCPARLAPKPVDALTNAADVLALVQSRSKAIRSISAEARVSIYGEEGARKAKMIIVARRPDSLHFQALAPTDQMLGILATDGARFTSFESGGKACYMGSACPENVSRMLPIIDMDGADIVELLAGGVPIFSYEKVELSWDGERGGYRLDFTADLPPQVSQQVWVAHGTGDVIGSRAVVAGLERFVLGFEDFTSHGDARIPHTIKAKIRNGEVDLRIVYRDVEVNGAVRDGTFVIPCPAALTEERLWCAGEDERPEAPPAPVQEAPSHE